MSLVNKLKIVSLSLVLTLVFAPNIALAQIPQEYKNCIPIVTNFTVNPKSPTSRTQQITITATVQTVNCTVADSGKWRVWSTFVDDNGKDYPNSKGIPIPRTAYIKSSDFKTSGANRTATYSISGTGNDLFAGQTGNTITLRPDMVWDDAGDTYKKNTSFQVKVTMPSGNAQTNAKAPTNAGTPATNAAAPDPITDNIGSIKDPFKGKSLLEIISRVIRLILSLIVMAAVIVIIIAGFRMIVGGSNPAQLKTAKTSIIWAIVGMVVAFMSFTIVAIVQNLLS